MGVQWHCSHYAAAAAADNAAKDVKPDKSSKATKKVVRKVYAEMIEGGERHLYIGYGYGYPSGDSNGNHWTPLVIDSLYSTVKT
jgi:hypothetical protein